jgi:uncharacterized protein (DUF1499 family)
MVRRLVLSLLVLISVWLSAVPSVAAASLSSTPIAALFSFPNSRPANLGINHDQLANCPKTPNCVSSFSTDPVHQIEPLRYSSSPEAAFAELKQTILALPRTQIVTETDRYLYAEFTSQIMGFVDDVEFYLDQPAGVIQVRSASRLGESDLGVNRKRIESIRAKLKEAGDIL